MKCKHCNGGFYPDQKTFALKRCMHCNPPILEFGLYLDLEGHKWTDLLPDERTAVLTDGLANACNDAAAFLDDEELSPYL